MEDQAMEKAEEAAVATTGQKVKTAFVAAAKHTGKKAGGAVMSKALTSIATNLGVKVAMLAMGANSADPKKAEAIEKKARGFAENPKVQTVMAVSLPYLVEMIAEQLPDVDIEGTVFQSMLAEARDMAQNKAIEDLVGAAISHGGDGVQALLGMLGENNELPEATAEA